MLCSIGGQSFNGLGLNAQLSSYDGPLKGYLLIFNLSKLMFIDLYQGKDVFLKMNYLKTIVFSKEEAPRDFNNLFLKEQFFEGQRFSSTCDHFLFVTSFCSLSR